MVTTAANDSRRGIDGGAVLALDQTEDGAARELSPVLVAIPAYNEERFIGSVVLQARIAGFTVLVVDDGSSDATADVAAAAGALVERHVQNQGKAAAMNTVFRVARRIDSAALVVLDGDGQHNVREISRLLAPIVDGQADIVIGSRFLGGSEGSIPGVRRLGQVAMTMMTNLASGTWVTDSQSGYRSFSRRAIDALLFDSEGFGVEVEMQFRARQHDLKIVEVPITAAYLDPPKRNVFRHGTMVLNGVLQLVERHRPLLYFGGPAAVLLFIGIGLGLDVTTIYRDSHALAIGYGLITVLCLMLATVMMSTALMLHALRGSFLDIEKHLRALSARATIRKVDV